MVDRLVGKAPEYKTNRGKKHQPTKQWLKGIAKYKTKLRS